MNMENCLYVVVRVVAESPQVAELAVSVGDEYESIVERPGYDEYGMTEQELEGTPGFSHCFTWPYQEMSRRLSELQAGETNTRQQREFGKFLYNQLFQGRADLMLQERITLARGAAPGVLGAAGEVKLRLVLDSPALVAVPWEYIYYPPESTYLALLPEVSLARLRPRHMALRRYETTSPLQIEPPLRILVVSAPGVLGSAPHQGAQDSLAVQELAEELDLLDQGVDVEVMRYASRESLEQRLQAREFHIVHFFAHLGSSADQPYLVLADERGLESVFSSRDLDQLLFGKQVRLLALTPWETVDQPWMVNLIGARVHEMGIPAALTTQVGHGRPWIADFFRTLYYALAQGVPVDLAVSDARRHVARHTREPVGAFALFLSTPDTRLFDLFDGTRQFLQGAWDSPQTQQALISVLKKAETKGRRYAQQALAKFLEEGGPPFDPKTLK